MNALSPGGCGGWDLVFSVNLAERKRTLLVDRIDVLRTVMRKVKAMHPFYIDAMVVLPDHLHPMWTLPEAMRIIPRGGR